jgi:hypothetical protein
MGGVDEPAARLHHPNRSWTAILKLPAGVQPSNCIQTKPGRGRNAILHLAVSVRRRASQGIA